MLPVVIAQRKCAAGGRRRTAHVVDENVEAAETSEHSFNDLVDALACADVSLNKQIR